MPWIGVCSMPSMLRRRRDAGGFEDRRADVDDVRELAAQAALLGDAARPADDHRVARAAEVRGDLLAPLERAVARPRPGRRVVRRHRSRVPQASRPPYCSISASCCSPVSTIPFCIVSSLNVPVSAALHAGAVVAADVDHERVVELAHLLDRVQDAADVPVGVLQEAREDLHLARQQRPLLLGDRVPRRERLVARRQLRVGRDHAELLLALEGLLAVGVPALVEAALVPVAPLRRDVVRRVRAARRVVDEPRLVGLLRAHAVQPLDRLVGHRVGQVEVLLLRRPDRRLVLGDHRVVLARLAAQEAPEVVEPEPVGPAVERARRTLLMVRRQVPLAERRGAVAVLLQHPRERRASPSERTPSSPGSPSRAHRSSRSRPSGGCGRSAAPRASASTAP